MRYRYWNLAALLLCGGAFAQTAAKVESHDMELVGFHDLQGRSAYQPLVHKQGNRWIAYIGHHGGRSRNPLSGEEEYNGTSVVDDGNGLDRAKLRLAARIGCGLVALDIEAHRFGIEWFAIVEGHAGAQLHCQREAVGRFSSKP